MKGKLKHILKAIASGFIWGLGQVFNRQYLKAAFFFFDAFGSQAINEISAKNAYIRLEPGCKFEYWISRLLYEFELNHSNHLELQLVGETDAKYNGNYYISDIVFRRKDSNGKVMQCA